VGLGAGELEEGHADELFDGEVLEGEELGAGHVLWRWYEELVVVCGMLKGGLKCVWYGMVSWFVCGKLKVLCDEVFDLGIETGLCSLCARAEEGLKGTFVGILELYRG
jgi:hypothetical protein